MTFTSFLIASFKKCHNSWSYLKGQEKKISIQDEFKLDIKKYTLLLELKLGNLVSKKDRIIYPHYG